LKKNYKQNWGLYIWLLKSISLPFILVILFFTPIVGNILYCYNLYEDGKITEKGFESCLWLPTTEDNN